MNVVRVMLRSSLVLAGVAIGCDSPDSQTGPAFGKAAAGPSVTAATPSSATRDTTLDVQVSGSGFDHGSTVQLLLNGAADSRVRINSTRYVSGSAVIASLTISADAALSAYDVAVTTASGKKGIGSDLFVVTIAPQVLAGGEAGSTVRGIGATGYMAGTLATGCNRDLAPVAWRPSGEPAFLQLNGACSGGASGVNGAGVVVGYVLTSSGHSTSVRWVPNGSDYAAEALPALPDGGDAGAWAINESGDIAGYNRAAVLTAGSQAWTILQPLPGATTCGAAGINRYQAVVGRCIVAGLIRPVYWESPTASPVILPTPAGSSGAGMARAINDAGVVVGFSIDGTRTTTYRALRWERAAGTWTVGVLSGLGKSATAINSAGWISGTMTLSGKDQAAVWSPAGSLIPLGDGKQTSEALGINDALVVGGYVIRNANKVAASWRLPF